MRVDCYNACECPISAIEYGDTFYYRNNLWIKVNASCMPLDNDDCAIVALDIGELVIVKGDTAVIKADTKVVASTKEVQF